MKLLVSFGAAIIGGAAAAAAGAGRTAPLIGWDILALLFCGWVWSAVWRLDAKSTASHATIGMTFQVSDTDVKSKQIRRTALRRALMSFPLVAMIIATSINLVSGLAK